MSLLNLFLRKLEGKQCADNPRKSHHVIRSVQLCKFVNFRKWFWRKTRLTSNSVFPSVNRLSSEQFCKLVGRFLGVACSRAQTEVEQVVDQSWSQAFTEALEYQLFNGGWTWGRAPELALPGSPGWPGGPGRLQPRWIWEAVVIIAVSMIWPPTYLLSAMLPRRVWLPCQKAEPTVKAEDYLFTWID